MHTDLLSRIDQLDLPAAPPDPIGNFSNTLIVGDMLYVSGQGPVQADGTLLRGKVGTDVTAEVAYDHARLVGLNLLAAVKKEIGDWSRFRRVVKVLGLVNATPDFTRHPTVINGCSDLLVEVFGDAGVHTRSALGVGSLPNNITVEIEAIFQIRP
nr:RidA family protein [Qingshengfaniella alkalisoli]